MTNGIELVRPPTLSGTAPYAYAAVTDPGRMVFTAGACPLDADGATVAVGGVTVLGYPDQLVEVEAVAVRDSWREPAPPHDGDKVIT